MQTQLHEAEDRWRIYETALHVAWGDQRLAAAEVSAARAIAEELDLASTGRCAGETLRVGPRPWRDVRLSGAPRTVREAAYCTAVWMALVDGVEHPAEWAMLRALRSHLDLDEDFAQVLEASAYLVSQDADLDYRAQYRALLDAISNLEPDALRGLIERIESTTPPKPLWTEARRGSGEVGDPSSVIVESRR